jgi:hypothetical protein
MSRRLLPYEHQLIEALGISAQEYLEFAQVQFDHTRTRDDKLLTPQNEAGTIGLVLTIVGILFQVGAAILTPKPQTPSQSNVRNRRDAIFAPRYGFNSAQDLAKYGDPVNLIYCNNDVNTGNPTGGVRVATSLVWSAVQSFGSSQFMQMMAVVGASNIDPSGIDITRTAFGQTPIRHFNTKGVWLYLRQNGVLRFSDSTYGVGTDPTQAGESAASYTYRSTLVGTQREDGFSQAFSPSSLTKCGIFSPIPINVNYYDRKDKGQSTNADLGIELNTDDLGSYWPLNRLDNSRTVVPVGHRFRMRFKSLASNGASDVRQAASELRRTLVSYIDVASTYKLGSSHWRVIGPVEDLELDNDAINVTFECVKSGICPEEDYSTVNFKQNEKEAEDEITRLTAEITELNRLLTTTPPVLKPGIGNGATDRLNQINTLIDNIEELRDKRWEPGELDNILNDDGDVYDNRINPFAERVLTTRRNRDNERNQIEEWQDEIGVERKKNNTSQAYIDRRKQWIREARGRIETLSKRLRNQQAKLDWAIREYGYNTPKGGNLREDRKYYLRQQAELQRQIAQIYGDANNIDLAATEARNQGWQNQINAKTSERAYYESVLKDPELLNDFFNTKCLVKIEEAAYETITACRIVDFALKTRVYKRVQGRQKEYGEVSMDNYRDSDNGIKLRSMFFWLWYRRTDQTSEKPWTRVPRIFVVRRGSDVDNFISLKFIADDNIGNWQFKFEPIAETAAEMRYHGFSDFAYIENAGTDREIAGPAGGKFTFKGKLRNRDGLVAPINRNPSELDEWGLFSMRSDTQLSFSFDNGPELEIKAVTEQSTEPLTNYPSLYSNLTMLGFNIFSGQGVQDLRSLSVFVNKGRLVRRLNDDGTYSATPDTPTSFAPEVFLDTILDTVDGIGQYAKVGGIDLTALAKAKRFCQRNNLFFDGVIADPTSWRQFWAEVASYSLLELGRIGGKETLIPAVPCDNAGTITRTVPITALFNAGNILDGTYKEEFIDYGSSVQDLIATVIYRNTERDGVFPRNASVDVSLRDVTEASAIRQTFDLSQFVTNRSQAILYAKLLCQQRRHIRRNVEFRTFPTDSPLSPGSFIYVDIGQQEWQSIYSGQVESGGALNVPLTDTIPNGTYNVLLYRSGQEVVTVSAAISSNTAASLASYEGWLFVLGTAVKSKRVFRIIEVQMDEEGEVTVRAVEHPCDSSGQSLIADFTDSLFQVR